MLKFLIIDDHVVIRTGIKFLLFENYKPADIHEAFNGESAIALLKMNSYDLVILDVQMPDTDPLNLMEYIRITYPENKVLVYSMSSEKIYAKRFMKIGAMGFLSKDAPMQEITKAIDTVLGNKKYISSAIAEILAEDVFSKRTNNPFDDLSKREFEIVKLLLTGKPNSEISQLLHIGPSTVGTHKQRLFEKLSVENLLELKELATMYNL